MGGDDHDSGAAVAYSHDFSVLYYGAPGAQNWRNQPLYGSGRVYSAVFCRENEEQYTPYFFKSHVKDCRRCQNGTWSDGGRDWCRPCTEHPNYAGDKPAQADWVPHDTCQWRCKHGFFGANVGVCRTCSEHKAQTGAPAPPAHAHWVDGAATCTWSCDEHFPLSASGLACDLPSPPEAPADIRASDPDAGSVLVRWRDPNRDARISLLNFTVRVYASTSSYSDVTVVAAEADGPSVALAPADGSSAGGDLWWAYRVSDLLATSEYTFAVMASTAGGRGPLSGTSVAVTTLQGASPSSPLNLNYISVDSDVVVLQFSRPADLGGYPLSGITYTVRSCETDGSGSEFANCAEQTLSPVTNRAAAEEDPVYEANLAGLTASTLYSVSVAARTAAGPSSWSIPVQVTTGVPGAPSASAPPTLTEATSESMHVAWEAPARTGGRPIDEFKIRFFRSFESGYHGRNSTEATPFKEVTYQQVTAGTTSYSTTVTGLLARTQYRASVSAINSADKEGAPSALSEPLFTSLPVAPSAPRNPSISAIGSSWMDVQWQEPVDTGGAVLREFRVQLRRLASSGGSSSVITMLVKPDLPTGGYYYYRLDSLTAETSYSFSVGASNAVGNSPFSVESEIMMTRPVWIPSMPGRPALDTASGGASGGTIHVSWAGPADDGGSPITVYHVFVSVDGGTWPSMAEALNTTTNSISLTGLPALASRWVYVMAQNMAGVSQSSHVSARLTTTDVSPPGVPAVVSTTYVGATAVTVACQAPSDSGGVALRSLEVQAVGGSTGSAVHSAIVLYLPSVGVHSASLSGLQTNTSYTIRCRAQNTAGMNGAFASPSPTAAVVTKSSTTTPSVPRNAAVFAAYSSGAYVVKLGWDGPVDTGGAAISKYVVQQADTGAINNWGASEDTNADVVSHIITGLVPGSQYALRVAAVNLQGQGPWAETVDLFAAGLLVRNPAVTETTSSSIRVSWDAPAPSSGMTVSSYRVVFESEERSTFVYEGAATSVRAFGLTASSTYSIYVVASTSVANGPRCVWPSTVTTMATSAAPSPPQNPRLLKSSSSSLSLVWDAPADIFGSTNVSYSVTCSRPGDSPFFVAPSTTTSIEVTGLDAVSEYTCTVASVSEAGTSSAAPTSPALLSTSVATEPGPPPRPRVADVGAGHLSLSWTPPVLSGGVAVTGYSIQISQDGKIFADGEADHINVLDYGEQIYAEVTRLKSSTGYYFVAFALNEHGASVQSLPSELVFTLPSEPPSRPRQLTTQIHSDGNGGTVQWHEPEFFGGVDEVSYTLEENYLGNLGDACHLPSPIPGYTLAKEATGASLEYAQIEQDKLPSFARETEAHFTSGFQTVASGPDAASLSHTMSFSGRFGAVYLSRVRAESTDGGLGPFSSMQMIISPVETTGKPDPPTFQRSSQYNNIVPANEVLLSWQRPELRGCRPHTYYLLRHTLMDDGTWSGPIRIDAGGGTSTHDQGLRHTTTYKWQLVAVNVAGESEPSDFSTEVTTGKAAPSGVCSFELKATAMDVTLTWEPPCDDGGAEAPFPKYQVQFWRQGYGGNWNRLPEIPARATSYTHRLDDEYFNQEFVFQVRAANSVGFGPWNRSTVRILEPLVCQGEDEFNEPLECSGHGKCHSYDGTCACDYGYTGVGCADPNGATLELWLEGSIESFSPAVFRTTLASELNIAAYRIPEEFISVEAGSIKVTFVVLEESSANTTSSTVDVSTLLTTLQAKLQDGDLLALGAVSLEVSSVTTTQGSGATSSGSEGGANLPPRSEAPALPTCGALQRPSDDPCKDCLTQHGCGWCADSQACLMGTNSGPSITTGVCATGSWSFGGAVCPPTPKQLCSQHSACNTCMGESQADCAWCASSGKCMPEANSGPNCKWGLVPDACVARCARSQVLSEPSGYVWLGDDTPGSELDYPSLTSCKWTISPTLSGEHDPAMRTNSASDNEFDSVTLTFDRVDLGSGDSIKVFDATNSMMVELRKGPNTDISQMPLVLTSQSSMIVVEFVSDGEGTGTGFLASYAAQPRSFWDVYIVLGLSSLSMLVCVCCFCCWMRCKPDALGGRNIENNMGMDLQSTERGASIDSIKKFPKFCYSAGHAHVMAEIGQAESCTICLGDYESGEELRLLPCGHCFHAECVDAWLQINRICPICKVDVYDLLQEEAKRKRNLKKQQKLARKNKRKQKRKKQRDASEVTPTGFFGAIPSADKGGPAGTGGAAPLSPIEQFRLRSRRLLAVSGTVGERRSRAQAGASKQVERLPEIEMAVVPRPAPRQALNLFRPPRRPRPPPDTRDSEPLPSWFAQRRNSHDEFPAENDEGADELAVAAAAAAAAGGGTHSGSPSGNAIGGRSSGNRRGARRLQLNMQPPGGLPPPRSVRLPPVRTLRPPAPMIGRGAPVLRGARGTSAMPPPWSRRRRSTIHDGDVLVDSEF
ncbi:MAG: hypothetical protein CMA59_01435 [Euryarchaeota archaeon]|nr:hypothetical protein [Euryarchaeota archaeon]